MTIDQPEFNPYAPPSSQGTRAFFDHRTPTFDLLWTWEKLRIFYNLMLAVEVLVLSPLSPAFRLNIGTIAGLVVCAVGANVCFCCGPIANAYAVWLGLRSPIVTWLIFLSGMGLSALVAADIMFSPKLLDLG